MINYYSGFFISFILHLGLVFSFSNYFSIDFLSYDKDLSSIPAYVVYETETRKVMKPTKKSFHSPVVKDKKKEIVEDNKKVESIIEKLNLRNQSEILQHVSVNKKTELEKVMYFSSLIREQIMSNWIEPKSSKVGLKAEFIIFLVPTGEIIEVDLVRTSGDKAFDQSALLAISKINRFSDLQMSRKLFDDNFRKFTVVFSPKE